METREQIIKNMCMTYRHDFGLERLPTDPPWQCGLTKQEREGLIRTMSQIYDNDIAPIIEKYKGKNTL